MYIRLMSAVGLAALLILVLCTMLAGQAQSAADHTLATTDGLALSLSADGQVSSLQIDGQELASAPAPALVLRDLSQAGQVISPNLVLNPGFESGLDDWAEALNQGLQVRVVLSPTHSGDHALAFTNTLTPTAVAGYASKPITVTAGQRYRLSAWFLSSTGYVTYPTGTPPLMQMNIWQEFQAGNGIYVVWLDAAGTSLGAPELVAPLHADAYHWRLLRGEVTAPAAARQARAILGARISDQTLWVDDVAFVPSPESDLPLAGVVAPCPGQGGCLQQRATLTNGLTITVTYTARADHITVHGEVADTTGQDRALDVSWGVPLAAGDVDPDLDNGLASFLMDWRIAPAFITTTKAGAHLDGVQIDNFMSNPTFDLRPEALGAADRPLSYTPHTYQPAVHTGYAEEEFLAHLRRYLDQNWDSERGITINFWGLGHPNYLARYIDGFGSEGQLNPSGEGPNWNPAMLDYRRALTDKRPYLFTIQASGVTPSQAYTACQLALLYGVYPGHGPNGFGWDPAADQVVSDTAKLVGRYWAAGWEPLTYARADSDEVWIERFGGPEFPQGLRRGVGRGISPSSPEFPGTRRNSGELMGTQGALYFTIHNRSDITRTGTITVETTPLGITDPATAVLTDIAITQTLPFVVANGDIRFSLTLGPRQTRIVQVSGGVAQTTPTPTATTSPTPTPTPTPPASQCVGDANGNGIGDVVDIQATAAEPGCVQYLPIVVANWHQPWATATPTPGVTIRSDLTQPGSPLSTLLKPSANLHPMWGDRNQAPIAWWQTQVPRWQEGTYFFDLDLFHIERGDIDLAHGRYPDALVRFAGPPANAFIDIDRVPASLEPPECLQEENYPRHQDTARCAPTSYEAYQKVLEALLVYLSVPDVVMPDNQATQTLGIAGQPSLGLDGLRYIFCHEANSVGWWDTTAAWFKLYDYWIAAVRNVRNTYPGVNFEVGTEFMGDNRLGENQAGWQRNHQDLLNYLDLFLSFLNGNPPKGHEDYQYRAQPPLDLEFYAFNPRNNLNYHWINDWPDGFYQEIQDRFAQYGFGNMTYVAWALESGHLQVNAPVLPESEPDTRYLGAERDSEMGAAAQIALQYDVERSPVIPISYAWAEFLSDAGEDVNDFLPWDFPLFCGATGNAFTYAYYAKPTYNVMRLLGMQETTRVPAQITDDVSPPKREYMGAVVTRDSTRQHVVVLLWYYIPPEDLEGMAGRRYEDLRAYANAHLRTDLEVVLDGLGEGPYRLARYLVDETHSNGFHYRQAIADAKVPAEVVNGWLPGNNPYDASVALELVEERDGVSPAGGTLSLRYAGVAPWTVMLIDLRAD